MFSEICGICLSEGAYLYWLSPVSRGAHLKCFKLIRPFENKFEVKGDQIRTQYNLHNYIAELNAHKALINAVQKKCYPLSILKYLETYGPIKMQNLFDSVGCEAFVDYYQSIGIQV